MGKFIGYTIGLECFVGSAGIKSVKVEYSEAKDGKVKLQAVSGRNLGRFAGAYSETIARDVFEARPADVYNDSAEAIWALGMCNLTPAALEA